MSEQHYFFSAQVIFPVHDIAIRDTLLDKRLAVFILISQYLKITKYFLDISRLTDS